MEENKVVADNSNTAEVVVPETTEEVASTETTESIDWKSEAQKAKELAENYKVRAEKAERAAKTVKTVDAPTAKTGDLSSKDIIALMNAKVAEEDIDEVADYAKYKGISIAEALKTSTIKATLNERSEQRNTAAATNTGASRRGSSQMSEDALLSNAGSGRMPESDADIARLIAAKAKQGRR
jgi:hypothetical protein